MPGSSLYLGIDPGDNGGLVCLNSSCRVLEATRMPPTEAGVWNWVGRHILPLNATYAVIELVGGFMGVGLGKAKFNFASAHTMFTFGASYGGLRMALVGNGLHEDEHWWPVAPQRWQRWCGVGGRRRKETRSQFKARIKQRAIELFPQKNAPTSDVRHENKSQVTLKTCDAFVLALYCKNLVEGTLL